MSYERSEIRNPSCHAPALKHTFAECSLQYCLINQLNSENCFALLTDKVSTNSFHSFKVFIKTESSILTKTNNAICIYHSFLILYRSFVVIQGLFTSFDK